jgi:hypothetical protein
MLFSRLTRARRGSVDGLVVCEMCGSDFVSPMEWAEHDATYWWMRLRCGQCGAFREAIVSQEIADRYDRALDRTSEPIVATLARLERERMSEEVEAFATALRLDLFDAGDFARRGFPGAARER